ncbi:prepilin-type N-terminal cleavage/methylation domain-containing protein [Pseudoalteromonas ruthenica]|uniref:Prepilin-type N-terminal cleavage/methylation domain-containing protein n=1 Tax=Pseudoalteromonas ruthenica TaxID=151081 RepID=A0A0F4PHP9_9GAMM|nr:prepilin-type N-terminal cleavage/methylation domain-containing protein [Pseudoalteromonas ruthenica]KJY95000.1 hypothetical protein TW76_16195 [Pseudoalteromonas ruthenica]KJY98681.1 hypothetical protein TW72_13240 [Pseudoalteromonas ruthenica]TLX51296.1 prepilin-type cleavage/methylation domain-containing protein [Pseudoalteromonas ruthenica]TMO86974.1 prepilin-type cleavage/methylation domain-containing protein [Pseudoalteromonas ruthenica]TMO93766.1 prepilin-type cleavage/methylation do
MNNIKGFSLVELLVAVTIATMAIALTQLIYSNFVNFEIKASKRINELESVLTLRDEIIIALEDEQRSGTIELLGKQCNWSSEKREQYTPSRFDIDAGGYINSRYSYQLIDVEFSCVKDDVSSQTFKFTHLLWLKDAQQQ